MFSKSPVSGLSLLYLPLHCFNASTNETKTRSSTSYTVPSVTGFAAYILGTGPSLTPSSVSYTIGGIREYCILCIGRGY